MIITEVICDYCKSRRKQSSNWFIVVQDGLGLHISTLADDIEVCDSINEKHICSYHCLLKIVSAFADKVTSSKGDLTIEQITTNQ